MYDHPCIALSVPDSCDFETDLCNYVLIPATPITDKRGKRDLTQNTYKWQRIQGSSVLDKDYRPHVDHTIGTKDGEFINKIAAHANRKKCFVSPIEKVTLSHCFTPYHGPLVQGLVLYPLMSVCYPLNSVSCPLMSVCYPLNSVSCPLSHHFTLKLNK